jgi:hypothetical protein
MTVGELDTRMTLTELLAWQAFDQWRADERERLEAERDALAAGEPTDDMLEEAAREARGRGLDVEDSWQ